MARQGRFFRPKDKSVLGTKYDSPLERELESRLSVLLTGNSATEPLNQSSSTLSFHRLKVPYHVEHTYEPDFDIPLGDKLLLIEAKGYFQDASETQKYTWIKKALPPEQELIFVFQKPNKPLHWYKLRKDNTKMTHAEWAEKQGFRWYSVDNVEEIFNLDK